MFNPEEKQKYIAFKESQATLPEKYLDRLFESTKEIEYDLKVDVAEWTEPVIIEYCKNRRSPSLSSLVVMCRRLGEYADFINRLNKNNQPNKYNNITTDVLRSCIDEEKAQRRFLSRNEFYLDLNILDNAVDKFVLTALFEGIKGKGFEEIWRLQLKNITQSKVITHNGRVIELLDSKLYYLAHEAAEAEFYYTYGKGDAATKMIGEPDQIIKATNKKQHLEINDDPVMISRQDKNIFRKFERAANECGWEYVKPRTLLLSGQIEYTKRTADKHGISVEEAIYRRDVFDEVQKRYIKITDKEEFLKATKYVLSQSISSD